MQVFLRTLGPTTVFWEHAMFFLAPGYLLSLAIAQMLGDEQRGWAWTRALLGVPANEIHICGDGSAVELVTGLASAMGEELEVHFPNSANEEFEFWGTPDR